MMQPLRKTQVGVDIFLKMEGVIGTQSLRTVLPCMPIQVWYFQ